MMLTLISVESLEVIVKFQYNLQYFNEMNSNQLALVCWLLAIEIAGLLCKQINCQLILFRAFCILQHFVVGKAIKQQKEACFNVSVVVVSSCSRGLKPEQKKPFETSYIIVDQNTFCGVLPQFSQGAVDSASSETQGQIVGARESLNGRENMARRKVTNSDIVPRGSSRRSLLFFVPYFPARLDFPSPLLSAPGSPRMWIALLLSSG